MNEKYVNTIEEALGLELGELERNALANILSQYKKDIVGHIITQTTTKVCEIVSCAAGGIE